ncbi:MAG: precorrin-2 dehydrogenase/sirohydrochlorin ferrochelatase family protein [Methanobacteriaceae archaeon]
MTWTSLYLKMENKKVLILGTGEVGIRRANRFINAGSEVVLCGKYEIEDITNSNNPNINEIIEIVLDNVNEINSIIELKNKGASYKNIKDIDKCVDWADIVVIASSDESINDYTASISEDKILNRADFPEEGNLIIPSEFNIDDVQISIFTNGKSPLMAKELRKKIQSIIKIEDILKIKLQEYTRDILKKEIKGQKNRKDILYKISESEDISNYLSSNDLKKAKEYVINYINNYKDNYTDINK